MTFKPAIWFPIAVVLSVINVVGAGFAAGQAEPLHATIHAALALAFGACDCVPAGASSRLGSKRSKRSKPR